jgi:uncharacterized coiled-coil DUF342 family protein
MLEALKKKMEELGQEAQALVQQREQMLSLVQEIEVRLHQISGAISEFDKLLKDGANNEASKDNRSGISESSSGSTEATPAP